MPINKFGMGTFREHYSALGRVATAAIANGDSILNSWNENSSEIDQLGLYISTLDGMIQVGGDPSAQFMIMSHEKRLSYIEGFDQEQYFHVNDSKETVEQYSVESGFDGGVRVLEYQPESEMIDYYDGIKAQTMIYPYSENFGIREYRESLQQVTKLAVDLFLEVAEEHDIDIEAGEGEAQRESAQSRDKIGFQ